MNKGSIKLKIGIYGFGTVGKATKLYLEKGTAEILVEDPKYNMSINEKLDLALVCTEMKDADNAIKSASKWTDNITIRSTITPNFIKNHPKCNYWLEFDVTESQNDGADIRVLTDNPILLNYLKSIDKCTTVYNVVSPMEACLAKLFDNYMLSTIVNTSSMFNQICEDNGVLYDHVRNILLQDSRYPKSHTNIYKKDITSKCFDFARNAIDECLFLTKD